MYAFFEPTMAPSRSNRRHLQLPHPYNYQQQQYVDPFNMFASWIPTDEFEESDEEERLLKEALAYKQQQRLARQQYQLQLQREREQERRRQQQLAAEQERQRQYEALRAKVIAEYEAEQRRIRENQIQQEQLRRQREEAQRRAAIEEIFRRQLANQEEQERIHRQRAAAEEAAKACATAEAKKRQEQMLLKQHAESQSDASSTDSDGESEQGEDLLQNIFESLFFPHHKRPATDRSQEQPSKRIHRRARAEPARPAWLVHDFKGQPRPQREEPPMPMQPPQKPNAPEPKKEEKQQPPQRNLPGVVGDPNRPTDPSHREFERTPSPQTGPEFQQPDIPIEIEQPKALGRQTE